MQRGPRVDGQDRRTHDLLDGSRGQRCNSFSLRLNVLQKRQPPVAPGDPIGVAATQQIAFTDHSKQLQVRREHGTALMRFSSSRIATSRTLLPVKTETTSFVMISPAVFGVSMPASRLASCL